MKVKVLRVSVSMDKANTLEEKAQGALQEFIDSDVKEILELGQSHAGNVSATIVWTIIYMPKLK
jgi:hypothetical protein